MSSFLKSASRAVTDVREFLRESAGGNSIKYVPEKGGKHQLFIPYTTVTKIDEATGAQATYKSIIAITGNVHEWTGADGKFKSTMCIKGVVRRDENDPSIVLNNGNCPFCDRVQDAWAIYNYRKQAEEIACKLSGESREKHLKAQNKNFLDERKAKETKTYIYILVVKFKYNDNGTPVIGTDNLPEYELKVMKLSDTRVEHLNNQATNSGTELPGAELSFQYPNEEDRRLLVSQSTTTPIFPDARLTVKYPELLNKINTDVAKFEWDGIEKAFPEWEGMTSMEAERLMKDAFEQWDKYNIEKKSNPMAKYLEYVIETPADMPAINAAIPQIPDIPQVPTVGQVSGNGIVMPEIPVVAPQATPDVPDINDVFGQGAGATTLTI